MSTAMACMMLARENLRMKSSRTVTFNSSRFKRLYLKIRKHVEQLDPDLGGRTRRIEIQQHQSHSLSGEGVGANGCALG